ncbi:class I SAM-dependent methyltransferase [Corallococcus exercitus]|uniref:Class I SAM-dependent methyltransferase n=1 Tax=Corallococcus exercitus TaxID=2316736 RepID=A0A7Y4NBA1_9BACT|nr:class I SAM-dependent methyltransferase [Corallococcus exercitus]NOK07977.1 class I SAM-dependent methyltransferase [Corallococcus exercitus]
MHDKPGALDTASLHQARADIKSGALRGDAFRELLLSIPAPERDGWVDALLGFDEPPPDIANLPRGAVPYLPSGVSEILAMVDEVPLRRESAFVDLGSGLGRVVILAHLLSGARAQGVELQEPLVHRARARCAELALPCVSFVHANAADVELDGSVFFLYAPFNGEMLSAVLRRLEDVARRRPIVICTVDLELHGVPWLRERKTGKVSLTLYDSCVRGVPLR